MILFLVIDNGRKFFYANGQTAETHFFAAVKAGHEVELHTGAEAYRIAFGF